MSNILLRLHILFFKVTVNEIKQLQIQTIVIVKPTKVQYILLNIFTVTFQTPAESFVLHLHGC